MILPIAKLSFLLMKQMSRPLSNVIKNGAKNHPLLRRYLCIAPARAYNWLERKMFMSRVTKRGEKFVEMTEEEEVEVGANLLGEAILFTFLSIILFMEIARQGDKRATTQKKKDDQMANAIDTISDILEEMEVLKNTVKVLEEKVKVIDPFELDSYGYIPPEVIENRFWRTVSRMLKRGREAEFDKDEEKDPFSP